MSVRYVQMVSARGLLHLIFMIQGVYISMTVHSTKKPVTTMLTYPWKCTVLHCNPPGKHLETTGADDPTL